MPNGDGLAFFDDDSAERSIGGGFDFCADLSRFDLDEGFAFDDGITDGFEPFDDLPFVHSHAPLRKDYVTWHILTLSLMWSRL